MSCVAHKLGRCALAFRRWRQRQRGRGTLPNRGSKALLVVFLHCGCGTFTRAIQSLPLFIRWSFACHCHGKVAMVIVLF